MSELALTVGHVIVVGHGQLIADADVAELMAGGSSLEEAFMELTSGAVEYRATISQNPRRGPEMASPVTQGQVIRSEWIKLRTVRSSWFVLGATVLGIAAVPGRLPVLVAKAGVLAAVTFAVGLVTVLVTFVGGQALLGPHGISLARPEAVRAVFGSTLYLTVVAVLGLGLGFLIRSTAGGIATLIAVLFVLPVMVSALPGSSGFERHLPSMAGRALFTMNGGDGMLSPWLGFGVFLCYTVVVLAAAALALRRRDA